MVQQIIVILASMQALATYMTDSDRLTECSPPIGNARMDQLLVWADHLKNQKYAGFSHLSCDMSPFTSFNFTYIINFELPKL